jgi:hypothetical protein
MTCGLLGATAMSMRPSWSPVVGFVYAVPLPAFIAAPVV